MVGSSGLEELPLQELQPAVLSVRVKNSFSISILVLDGSMPSLAACLKTAEDSLSFGVMKET